MVGRRIGCAGATGMAVACLLTACGGSSLRHRVRPGETLYAIGRTYGVPYQELARVNHIADPDRIRAGRVLRIPRRHRLAKARRAQRRREHHSTAPARSRRRFVWPLVGGVLTSGFGPRGRGFHEGVDIGAPLGTPVHAAAPGRVLYSNRLHGYGNVVIIAHRGGFATVYAHNQHNLVRAGELVARGQIIATVGHTGQASGPNLHFEVRRNNVARDPLEFLPPGRALGLMPTVSREQHILAGGG